MFLSRFFMDKFNATLCGIQTCGCNAKNRISCLLSKGVFPLFFFFFFSSLFFFFKLYSFVGEFLECSKRQFRPIFFFFFVWNENTRRQRFFVMLNFIFSWKFDFSLPVVNSIYIYLFFVYFVFQRHL